MNKHLRAKRQSMNACYFNEYDFKLYENNFEAAPIKVKNIFSAVTCESRIAMSGFNNLHVSLATKGMLDPLIVIANNEENYNRACVRVYPEYINTDMDLSREWLALTGNSRLVFAEGYKYDTVDCFIVPNFVYMHALQLAMQDGVIKHEV